MGVRYSELCTDLTTEPARDCSYFSEDCIRAPACGEGRRGRKRREPEGRGEERRREAKLRQSNIRKHSSMNKDVKVFRSL